MLGEWQLEAVHEQFRCQNNREESLHYFTCSESNINTLLKTVRSVISKHLRAPSNLKIRSSEREIAAQIIKAALSDSKADSNRQVLFKFSFIVIITNQDVNNRLCKIPIFVVEVENQCLFIDLKCSLYKSWKAFLQSNDLPACDFCYPVDGKYSDKLKIDYVKSPASSNGLMRRLLTFGGKLISCGVIAGTFFFKIAQCAFECVNILAPIANKLVPVLEQCVKIIAKVGMIISKFKSNRIGIIELTQEITELLQSCDILITIKMFELWIEIKQCFGSAYAYLKDQFRFGSSSSSSGSQHSHQVMAVTYKTDSEFKDIKKNADIKVQASAQYNETVYNSPGERNKDNSTALMHPNITNILAKSKADYENSSMIKKEFARETCDLVSISANIAKQIQGSQSESVYVDIFETLSDTVKTSYESNIKDYLKTVKAAEQGAGHRINLVSFNAALGIHGDYKEHFWTKTCLSELSNHGSKLGVQIKIKMEKLKSKQQIMIHPITQDNYQGLFLWKSHKAICDKDIFDAIQENIGLNIKEEDLVINVTGCNTMIRNQDYIICVYQSDQTVHEGLMIIHEFK